MERLSKLFPSGAICLLVCLLPVGTAICSPDQFTCMNDIVCISKDLVNNTFNDCGDNSDEGAPPGDTCGPGKPKFKCRSGWCVVLSSYLDGDQDCDDKTDEYKIIGTRCFLAGDKCCPCNETVASSICTPVDPSYDSTLIQGVCRCISGWRNNSLGTECIRRQIGDACDIDADCFDAIPNTACTSGQCLCASGHYRHPNQTSQCIRRKINDSCQETNDCSMAVNESTCLNNKCQCNLRYQPTKDLSQCVMPLINAFECSSDSECHLHFNNTVCSRDDGLCLCDAAFYPDVSRRNCIRYELDSPCSSSWSCQASMNNTTCVGQKCACDKGFFRANRLLCLPRTIGMDGCLVDDDCAAVHHSMCNASGVCICQLGHQAIDNKATCLKRVIGDLCQSRNDCAVAVARTVCIGGRCRCEPGYREANLRTCVVLKVGDECQEDSECKIAMENSSCSAQRKCVCSAGYKPTETGSGCRRAPVDEIGCYNDSSCQLLVRNSVCSDTGKCSCAKGYYPDVERTGCALLQVGVLPCDSNERCSKIMNSTTCSPSSVCVCVPGYYPNIASNYCVNVILGKTECTEDDTCSSAVYKATCMDGRCQCVVGYKALAGRSCVATHLGQACQRDDHCAAFIEHSVCLNQTCACAQGFNTTDEISCLPVTSDQTSVCVLPSICPGWCAALIGFFLGTFLASVILGGILCKKKLKKRLRNKRRVGPLGMGRGMNDRWQLDWNNRPPAHVPVMYKSPSMKAPEDLYGDLLNFDFNGVLFEPPVAKTSTGLPASHV